MFKGPACRHSGRSGQHLVEFMLFFPFFVAILGILLDYSFAFYTNYRFNLITAQAISSVWMDSKIDLTVQEIADRIQNSARNTMSSSSVPYADSLKVSIVNVDDMSVVVASYDYTTAFTFVNTFFPTLPKKFSFGAVFPVSKAILEPNTFPIADDELKNYFESLPQETGGEGD